MNDLSRRISRLEALRPIASPSDTATVIRHQRRMAGFKAFVLAAFPGSNDCVAFHVARVLGLPDSPALSALLQRAPRDPEAIARDRYGEDWRAKMQATAAEAAVRCEAAHGSDWQDKFAEIWQSGVRV